MSLRLYSDSPPELCISIKCYLMVKYITPLIISIKITLFPWLQVSSDQAKNVARDLRLHYMETSAKLALNVNQAFCDCVRHIRKFHEEERSLPQVKPKKKKRSCSIL